MARIYVSSTFSDLQECREQVRLTLRRMGHEDVAMEYYTAEEARPLDKCLRDVDSCDLYICLVAWRYGFVPKGLQHSITELEYRQAVKADKPRLVFLLDKKAEWSMELVETAAFDKVQAFRQELEHNQLLSYFTGAKDIGARVAEAVHNWGKRQGVATGGSRTDWEAYRTAVFDKHRWIRLAVIAGAKQDRRLAQIPLTDVFVAQRTTAGRPAYDVPEDPLDAEAAASAELPEAPAVELPVVLQEPSLEVLGREPKQVVLGGPGTGKSTLFHFAMLTLCDPVPSEGAIPPSLRHGPLPFLIELRQYTLKKARSFVDYLVEHAREFYGVDVEADDLRAVLQQQGRALVLFDGLDEILNPAERAQVVDQFDAFARQYAGAGIVVSSRIAGYDPERLQLGGFDHYTLLDFGLTEIRVFVPRWYRHYTWQEDERDAAGLLQRIAESPRLLDLAGNPLLLTMMAVIYKHQDLPEKRWQLYQRCTQVLLEDWDVKRKNIERDELLPLDFHMVGEQKAEILANVSMHMLLQRREGGELNAIHRGPLIAILADYLEQTYNKAPGDARAIATDILNHLRERTYILAEIGESIFGFVHRTFMEYFAATQARAEFNRRRADYQWLTQEVFGAHWQQDEWREVLLLLIAMVKDQGSPIEEVVDHLLQLKAGQPPWNLEFAARCLGEAGATDGAWAQDILHRLVKSVVRWADETSKEEINRFVDQGLTAFSMLVPAVPPSEALRMTITESAPKSRLHRMVAWQMELALRSREGRLEFATAALDDPEEAVRLGAIATLEREWPGREEVGPVLVEMLRSDRITRVRQAAVQVLRRSWPEQPGIFEAIAERIEEETASTHVIWLVKYVSTEWRQELRALEVVLRLAGTKRRPAQGYDYHKVTQAAARGILDGWSDQPGMLVRLQDRFRAESDPRIRDAILIAIASGWADAVGLLGWLQEQMDNVVPKTRSAIMDAVGDSWSGRPDALAWLQGYATGDDDDQVRIVAVNQIAKGWHQDSDIRAWLEQLAVDDPAPEVRSAILLAVARNWDRASIQDLLRRRALEDGASEVRIQALTLAVGFGSRLRSVWRPGYLPWLIGPDWTRRTDARLEISGTRRLSPDVLALLEEVAVNDPVPEVRSAAMSGVFHGQPILATTLDLLRSQLVQDSDQNVRAAALLYLANEVVQDGSIMAILAGMLHDPGGMSIVENRLQAELGPLIAPPSGLDKPSLAAFEQAAEHDEDASIRAAATLAAAAMRQDQIAREWLEERARAEKHPKVHSFLKQYLRRS
jgi:hypothetical protein